ncbi:MAG TPA: hypothetical protein VH596_16195 [Terriglobales bacterium]
MGVQTPESWKSGPSGPRLVFVKVPGASAASGIVELKLAYSTL